VQAVAEGFGLDVRTPASLKPESEAAELALLQPDAVVVVAYGQILPRAILDVPGDGCLNLHGSLLPRWRGAAPIERAIMAGDVETGVMVMRMEAGLDTGPVALVERVAIGSDDTAGDLTERLSHRGADLMARAVTALSRRVLAFTPQTEAGVTYAKKIDKAETRIEWNRPAAEVHNHIRGLSPDPGAWFEADFGKGPERVRVLRSTRTQGSGPPGTVLDERLLVACSDGGVRLLELQRAGRQPLKAEAFLRGTPIAAGSRLA
jgi:methionyl-tRNA formyltransferase